MPLVARIGPKLAQGLLPTLTHEGNQQSRGQGCAMGTTRSCAGSGCGLASEWGWTERPSLPLFCEEWGLFSTLGYLDRPWLLCLCLQLPSSESRRQASALGCLKAASPFLFVPYHQHLFCQSESLAEPQWFLTPPCLPTACSVRHCWPSSLLSPSYLQPIAAPPAACALFCLFPRLWGVPAPEGEPWLLAHSSPPAPLRPEWEEQAPCTGGLMGPLMPCYSGHCDTALSAC